MCVLLFYLGKNVLQFLNILFIELKVAILRKTCVHTLKSNNVERIYHCLHQYFRIQLSFSALLRRFDIC